jgi:Tfp pilus assembly protein PilF
MAITLPAILFLIDYWEKRDRKWNLVVEKIPFAVLSVVFGVLAIYTQSGQAMEVALDAGPVNRFFLVFYGIFLYFFKLVWPFGLAGIHYYPKLTDGTLPLMVYISPIIIVALFWGLWQLKSIRREVIFGLLFFILSISIVLQLLPFGYAIIAERYTYVPYLGLFFILAHVFNLVRDGKLLPSLKSSIDYVAIGLIAFFTLVTFQRAPIWENALTFYGDLIEKYPEADHAHWMLGNVQKDYGMTQDAILTYNKTIELNPEYAMAYFNRGVMFAKLNKHQDAIKDYNKTLLLEEDYVAAYNNKGNSLKALGSSKEAIEMYNTALELDSNFSPSYAARADAYLQMGQFETARMDYEKASKLSPYDFQLVYMQGVCFYNLGKIDSACALWKVAASKNVKEAIDARGKFCPK